MEIAFLIFGIFAATALVILAVVIYNQMLMVNEVNKRLLLMTKESIEKERITMAELESWIKASGSIDAPIKPVTNEQSEGFDPFSFNGEQKKEETDL
jgi:hypothetical protein